MKTNLKSIIASLAVGAMAGLAPAGVAHAEGGLPSCHDQGCNGLMPNEAGCDTDARPLASFYAKNGSLVDLRYSPSCDAAWARLSGAGQGSGTCNGWNDDDVVRIEGADWQGPGNDSYDNCLVNGADQVWTAMIGFGWNVKACYELRSPWASEEPNVNLGCTALK